jgi:hypothetical protein
MMEKGICFSAFFLKLTTMFRYYLSLAIVLAREYVKVRLRAPRTKNEHIRLFVWANYHVEKLYDYWLFSQVPIFAWPAAYRTGDSTTWNFNNISGSNRSVERPRTL